MSVYNNFEIFSSAIPPFSANAPPIAVRQGQLNGRNVTRNGAAASTKRPSLEPLSPPTKKLRTVYSTFVNDLEELKTHRLPKPEESTFARDLNQLNDLVLFVINDNIKQFSSSVDTQIALKMYWKGSFLYLLEKGYSPIRFFNELFNHPLRTASDITSCLIQMTLLDVIMEMDNSSLPLLNETEEQKFLRQAFWRANWETICDYASSHPEIAKNKELQSYWIAAELQQKNYNWSLMEVLSVQLVLMDLKSWQYVSATQPQVDQLVLCLKRNYPRNPQPSFFKDCNLELAYQLVAIPNGHFHWAYSSALFPLRMRHFLTMLSKLQQPLAPPPNISPLPTLTFQINEQPKFNPSSFLRFRPSSNSFNNKEVSFYIENTFRTIFEKREFFTPVKNHFKTNANNLSWDIGLFEGWDLAQGWVLDSQKRELHPIALKFCELATDLQIKSGEAQSLEFIRRFFAVILRRAPKSYFALAWMEVSLKLFPHKFFGEHSLAVAFFKRQYNAVCALCLQQLQTTRRGTEEYHTAISLFIISKFLLKTVKFRENVITELSTFIILDKSKQGYDCFAGELLTNVANQSGIRGNPKEKEAAYPILYSFAVLQIKDSNLTIHPLLYSYFLETSLPDLPDQKKPIATAILQKFQTM